MQRLDGMPLPNRDAKRGVAVDENITRTEWPGPRLLPLHLESVTLLELSNSAVKEQR
jgi:hypothetical protein